ncbi:glycerophosphodiester phosphodiesterase family protein [Altererythrobacter arenosus]|uniref:glycerophosphodiester phosphodiesterase n=1 Tax=Altererythrobacter arenosus TaxID=3032592 RepID=A0ABY8FVT2_9SPHN|nr:glycerophosphodiester phosphodiesterase family protein [Altererythrobacter sp. CAU 1644]WFL78947.1 glycerophosphodiester phosphodiesterase family protein [Altererythrobacter sp. CAU 1644]
MLAALFAMGGIAQAAEGPIIIAHRGASAERPEHTLAAYERAIDQGADYIEPDLVVTKDLVLVVRHENNLADTTDVSSREEFEDRRRDKTIDGQKIAGWFAEDFTLEELRILRAKERIPAIRPANARFNGLYQVPTLEEVVKLVRAKEAETGRRIGIYPELKHPSFLLQEAGIDMVDLLLKEFRTLGVTEADPVFVQSFEVGTLQRLNQRSDFKLVQLVKPEDGPADEPDMRYAEMVTPSGLAEIAEYADAIGAHIGLILGPDGSPTTLIADAGAAGLEVHAWTLRPENAFLPPSLQGEGGDQGRGKIDLLKRMLVSAGVTGIFTDAPNLAVQVNSQAR